ncbi:MAG: kelch repeat-containing protein, partial [Spartobacteria bacterium]
KTTGSLLHPRYYQTATLLQDGKVLVTAGADDTGSIATAELYDPATRSWTATGSLVHARFLHTATLLPDGQVLVAGGVDNTGDFASAELYDPATGTWTETGSLTDARKQHTATLLANGKVLVAGGDNNSSGIVYASAELYDPATGVWTNTGSLATARRFHTATLLPNGKILAAGGRTNGGAFQASAELYDPASGTWTDTASFATARELQSATLLPNGRVLLAGGLGSSFNALASVELYDVGLGFVRPDWQPQIASATSPLISGGSLALTGSRFQGVSPGSSGSFADSSTNYPVVQLRSIDNGQIMFLQVDPATGWSDTTFHSAAVNGFPSGPALVTVFTNGIPSDATYLQVGKATPALTTQASANVTAGGTISDTATLSGGSSPGGTITFNLFGPDDATCGSASILSSTVVVSGNGTYSSAAYVTSQPGTYRWVASYSGDASNAGVNGACNDANESVTVAPAPPPTPTPSPTVTPTPTPSPTVSPSPTPTPSPTSSPSPTPTPSMGAESQNLSTRLLTQTGEAQGIGGFIITPGDAKQVVIRGLGPSLGSHGISDFLADPELELHGPDGAIFLSNNNWRDTQEAQIEATGFAPTDDLDAAILVTLDPGAYTVFLRGHDGGTGVGLVEIYDLDSGISSHLGNLSTRAAVQTGENVVIAGFILGVHETNAVVVIRGLGPSLAQFGLSNVLADPTLELHDGDGALIQSDDNWQDDAAQAALLSASGLAPENELEAAMEVSLPPGAYTAILAGNGGSGVGIVEIYNKQ